MPYSMTSVLALSAFLATVLAEDVSTGYADVNRPYDLPSHVFQPALDSPAASGTYALTNFGPSNGTWDLEIHIASDVPLAEATDENGNGFGNNKVAQLSILAMIPPDLESQLAVEGDDDICAIVFRGLTSEANREANDDDGTCETLNEECRNDLISVAEERDGCGDIDLPESCSELFPADIEQWGFGVHQEAISATGRYFGHVSNAENRGSDDAQLEYERAKTHVWPVILSWRNSIELLCLRAQEQAERGELVTDGPDRDYSEDDDDDDHNVAGKPKASLAVSLGALIFVCTTIV